MPRSHINGLRLTFDTATFRKFINAVLHTKSTTEIREESVESDGGIGAIITYSLQIILSPLLNCTYSSVLSVSGFLSTVSLLGS